MIGILIALLFAALAWYVCGLLGLPAVIGIIVAIVVLLGFLEGGPGPYGGGRYRRW